jgi:hypothetical protein
VVPVLPGGTQPPPSTVVPTVQTRTEIVAGEQNTLQLLLTTLSAAADPTSERRKAMKIRGFYISDMAYPVEELDGVSYKHLVNFSPDMSIQTFALCVTQ